MTDTCRHGSRLADVADVDLDGRRLGGHQRVVERVAVVGERAGVDDHAIVVALLQAVDEGALVVRLERVEARAAAAARSRAASTTWASVVEP